MKATTQIIFVKDKKKGDRCHIQSTWPLSPTLPTTFIRREGYNPDHRLLPSNRRYYNWTLSTTHSRVSRDEPYAQEMQTTEPPTFSRFNLNVPSDQNHANNPVGSHRTINLCHKPAQQGPGHQGDRKRGDRCQIAPPLRLFLLPSFVEKATTHITASFGPIGGTTTTGHSPPNTVGSRETNPTHRECQPLSPPHFQGLILTFHPIRIMLTVK